MKEEKEKYSYQITKQLEVAREKQGISPKEAAAFFGSTNPKFVRSWELGYGRPNETRRSEFLQYLWYKLGLRTSPYVFVDLLNSLATEWKWKERLLSESDSPSFPEYHVVHRIINEQQSLAKHYQMLKVAASLRDEPKHDTFAKMSDFRRTLYSMLAPDELAFALFCSLHYGINVPFWARVNRGNVEAIRVIRHYFEERSWRQPLLRSAYALEALDGNIQRQATDQLGEFIERISKYGDFRKELVNAATQGKVLEYIAKEVRQIKRFDEVVDSVLLELLEKAD